MQNIKLLDREDKTHLDDLIDYFMRVFSGIALRTGYDEANRNTGSTFFRFVVEHTPNSCFSALSNIRDGEFESNDQCCYVMVRGPVSLTLWDESDNIEMLTVRSDGTVSLGYFLGDSEELTKVFYTERSGDTTVIAVPMDANYRVNWTARWNAFRRR